MRNPKTVLVFSILAIFVLFFTNSVYAKIDVKNLVGLWLFDEGKGDVAKDSSGKGNDGKINGKASWVKGKFKIALDFDGNSFVQVPDSDSLDMNEQVTVMFWIATNKIMKDMWADRQIVAGKHYQEYEVGIYMQGQIHTYSSNGAGGNDEGIMASIAGKLPDKDAEWELKKWYHISWTLNGAHEIAYVNGIKLGEADKATKNTKPGLHPLEIGRRVEGGLNVTGSIDEVAVFNVALNEADINSIYEKGFESALGITAVESKDKLATKWAELKK